jgi:hypothetical protein
MANYLEAKMVKLFGMLMAKGREAGDWWKEMKETRVEETKTMAGITKLFEEK